MLTFRHYLDNYLYQHLDISIFKMFIGFIKYEISDSKKSTVTLSYKQWSYIKGMVNAFKCIWQLSQCHNAAC